MFRVYIMEKAWLLECEEELLLKKRMDFWHLLISFFIFFSEILLTFFVLEFDNC